MSYDDQVECTLCERFDGLTCDDPSDYRDDDGNRVCFGRRAEKARVENKGPHPQGIDPADAAVDIAVSAIMANSVKLVKMAQRDKWARELIRTMVQSDLW